MRRRQSVYVCECTTTYTINQPTNQPALEIGKINHQAAVILGNNSNGTEQDRIVGENAFLFFTLPARFGLDILFRRLTTTSVPRERVGGQREPKSQATENRILSCTVPGVT